MAPQENCETLGEEHTKNTRGSHVMPRLVAKAADTLPEIDLRGRSEL